MPSAALGGGALMRGSGMLQGFTDPGSEAVPPPEAILTFSSLTQNFTVNVTTPAGSYNFTAAFSDDPFDGSTWVDSTLWTTLYDAAYYMKEAIVAAGIADLTVYNGTSDSINFLPAFLTGALSVTNPSSDAAISATGGGDATPAVDPSGEVVEVEIIAADGNKTLKPVRLEIYSIDGGINAYVEIALKVGVVYYPISPLIGPFTASHVPIAWAMFDEWINGRAGASLSARMVENDGSPAITIPAGGTLTVWAVAEQV